MIHLLSYVVLLIGHYSVTASDLTTLHLPLTRQFIPPAVVGVHYNWSFAKDTFISDVSFNTSFTISDGSNWLSLDSSTCTFSGTPSSNNLGTPQIRLIATDIDGDKAFQTITFLVTDKPLPLLTLPLSNQIANSNLGATAVSASSSIHLYPNQYFEWTLAANTFSSNNSQVVLRAIQSNREPIPTWLSFSSNTRTLRARPPEPIDGSASFDIDIIAQQADYPHGLGGSYDTFTLIISNHKLVIGDVINGTAEISTSSDNVLVFDVLSRVALDNTTIQPQEISSVSVDTTSAPWLSYDSSSHILSGKPSPSSPKTTNIEISYVDHFNDSIKQNFVVHITHEPFIITALPTQYVTSNQSLSFSYANYLMASAPNFNYSLTVSPPNFAQYFSLPSNTTLIMGQIPINASAFNASLILSAFNPVTRGISSAFLSVVYAPMANIPSPSYIMSVDSDTLRKAVTATGIIAGLASFGLFIVLLAKFLKRQPETPRTIFMGTSRKTDSTRNSFEKKDSLPPMRTSYYINEDGILVRQRLESSQMSIRSVINPSRSTVSPSDRIRNSYQSYQAHESHDPEDDPSSMMSIFSSGDPNFKRRQDIRGLSINTDFEDDEIRPHERKSSYSGNIDRYRTDNKQYVEEGANKMTSRQKFTIRPLQTTPTQIRRVRQLSSETSIHPPSSGGQSDDTYESYGSGSPGSYIGVVDADGRRFYHSRSGGIMIRRESGDINDPNTSHLSNILHRIPPTDVIVPEEVSRPTLRHKAPFKHGEINQAAKLVEVGAQKRVSQTIPLAEWHSRSALIRSTSDQDLGGSSSGGSQHQDRVSPALTEDASTFVDQNSSASPSSSRFSSDGHKIDEPIGLPTVALVSDPSKTATPSRSKVIRSPQLAESSMFFSANSTDTNQPSLKFPEAARIAARLRGHRKTSSYPKGTLRQTGIRETTNSQDEQRLIIEASEPFHYSVNEFRRSLESPFVAPLSATSYTEFVARTFPDNGPLPEWLHFEKDKLEFWGIPYFENCGQVTIRVVERWIGAKFVKGTLGKKNRSLLGLSTDDADEEEGASAFGDDRIVAQFTIDVRSSEDPQTRRQYRDEEFEIVSF